MKNLLIIAFSLVIVACNQPASDNMPPAPEPGTEADLIQNDDDTVVPPADTGETDPSLAPTPDDLSLGDVVIEAFTERQAIGSPLELSGMAPRAWFFEGIVPITIMTLEEDVVAEGYGSGAWLEPNIDGELAAEDLISFTSTIEFTAPAQADMGKIRIAQDATGSDETGVEPEYVEAMILWAE